MNLVCNKEIHYYSIIIVINRYVLYLETCRNSYNKFILSSVIEMRNRKVMPSKTYKI